MARDLGIPAGGLYRWRAQHRQAEAHGTTRAAQRAEAEELTRVKREFVRVTQERDVLPTGCPWNRGKISQGDSTVGARLVA
ncbi:MAG: transposase [Nitrospiraceae bacterium]